MRQNYFVYGTQYVCGFHNDSMPISHMDFMQDGTCQRVGPNWATCERLILAPDLGFMWVQQDYFNGLKYWL